MWRVLLRYLNFILSITNQYIQLLKKIWTKMKMMNLFIFLDRIIVCEDENVQLLAQTSSREESVKEKRESVAERRVLARLRRRKGKKEGSGNPREWSEEVSILRRNSDIEAFLFKIIKMLAYERNSRHLHLIIICPSHNSRRGQLTWISLKKIMICTKSYIDDVVNL